MSDSEDLDAFQLATPDAPRPAQTAKPSTSRPQAGPSRTTAVSKTVKKPGGRTAEQSGAEDHDAKKLKAARARKPHQEIVEIDAPEDNAGNIGEPDDEVVEMEAPPHKPQAATKKPSSRSNVPGTTTKPDSKTNGLATNAAAKGKAKAKPQSIVKPPSKVAENVMEVDGVEEDAIEDADEDVVPVARPAGKARMAGTGKMQHRPRRNESQEVARLTEQLSQAEGFIDDLKKQLAELYSVRHTEAEQLMDRMEQQHNITMQVQDNLVKELTEKLTKHDPTFRKGKNNVFELLTRDEADKETQALQDELEKYKKLVSEKDRALKDKDMEIDSLRDDQRALKVELQAEIERAKSLVEKSHRQPHGSAQRNLNTTGVISSHNDPKQTQIIRFYEDLSNVLVPSMKSLPGRYCNTEDWMLNCCYTYTDVTDPTSVPKSLSFNLRLCWEPKVATEEPIENIDQLVESVQYLPKDLDHESEEFRAGLGFLAHEFTFERTQLSLFMRTMHDTVSGEKAGEDEDDESVMLVE